MSRPAVGVPDGSPNVAIYRDRYLAAASVGDRRGATDIALSLLEAGYPADRIVTDMLGPAQVAIGDLWHRGEWTVAMEHRATAITEAALRTVTDTAMSLPGPAAPGPAGRVVIACSEGEWHVMPGLMATEVLRLHGADVSFIGPSLPASEVSGILGDDPPSAVAVTCSMPLSLMGAWRTISALRAIGMTVVCGGGGFGPDGRWGLAIGADVWAADFRQGADLLLDAITGPRPAPRPPGGTPSSQSEVERLLLQIDAIIDGAHRAALRTWPSLAQHEPSRRATREDLVHTLRAVGASTIAGDDQIVRDFVTWLEQLLASRDLPQAFVPASLDLLLGEIPEDLTEVRMMAAAGRAACTSEPWPFDSPTPSAKEPSP